MKTEEFENKLLQVVFLAIEVQKIVRFIRRKCKQFKQKGFISLQRILCSKKEILDLLQNQINVKIDIPNIKLKSNSTT